MTPAEREALNRWMQDKSTDDVFMLYLILAVFAISMLAGIAELFYKLWKEAR